jgi:TonB-linked SusC/RagA family outer membrane protein
MKGLLFKGIGYSIALASIFFLNTGEVKARESRTEKSWKQQVSAKAVLDAIAGYYKVNLVYENSLLQNKFTAYKFSPAQTTLEKALQDLLTPLGLKASRLDSKNYSIIAIKPLATRKEANKNETVDVPDERILVNRQQGVFMDTSGKEKIIKGRVVTDDNEEPISGASIVVLNSRTGTTSDAEGYFTLKVPSQTRTINIGHVNYNSGQVIVDSRNLTVVKLKAKSSILKDVVVTNGLFRRPKESFTGAATSVTGEELRRVNSISVLDALKVFDPSVRIPDNMEFGSDPNRLPVITLRGTNNFPQQTSGSVPSSGADFMANYGTNPNQPLFILDGYEVSIQKIYDLDMTRIANFTILKDAAATSVYGSRAANGVIVVDTKQPEAGKLRLSYSGMMQVTGPDLTVYDLTNAAEKLEVERLAGLYSTYASGIRPDADAVLRETYANRLAAVQRGVNTYWLSKPVQTGFGQRHSLFLEGGDSHFRYGIDLGYNSLTGVMKNSGRNTYSGAMNFSYRNKNLLLKNVLSVAFNDARNSNYGSFSDYTRQNPYWNPTDENGNYVKVLETVITPNTGQTTSYYNPLYNSALNTVNTTGYSNVINQTNIDWNIGKGFRVIGRVGITKQSDESDLFLSSQHTSFATITDITKKGSYTKGNGNFFSYDANLQMEYSKKIGLHQLFNSTGVGAAQTKSDFTSVYVEGFPNQRLDEIVFGNAYPANSKPTGASSISRRVSGFSNFSYSYDGRYQTEVSLSADGSSQFGINNKFAPFWSVGGSWNLHKEKFFLHSLGYANQLRLRASMGTTGDSRFPPYLGITTYRYYTDQSVRGQLGATIIGYGNPDLKWQQTFKRNIGTDISFFKSRINLTVDFYRENTKSLILDINTPTSTGFSSYRENIGELENKGYEIRLNAFVLRNEQKGMNWSIFVNGGHNTNYIKQISNSLKKQNELNDKNDQTRPQSRYQEGQSVNAIWAVRSLGIDPSNGREIFLNRFDSMTYVWNPLDKVIVGDAVAKLRGNFGTNFTWKGFTVGMYFSYEFGGKLYNQTLADRVEDANLAYNVDRRVLLGRWKTAGDLTYFKGLVDENGRTVTTKTNATSRFVQKNNYINAESITVSYQFSQKLNKQLGLNNTRINFTVNDLQRWSSIEVERGTAYPFARNFTVNISTQF